MSADDFLDFYGKQTLPGIAELLDAHTYTADLHSANRNNGSGTPDWRLEYSFKGKFGLPDMSEPAKTSFLPFSCFCPFFAAVPSGLTRAWCGAARREII